MEKTKEFTCLRYNEQAIFIQFQKEEESTFLKRLLMFKKAIEAFYKEALIEVVLAYDSILVHYKNYFQDFEIKTQELRILFSTLDKNISLENHIWEVPVCYDLEFATDIESFTQEVNLSVNELVNLHASVLYTVSFLGFLPGFMYLDGLSKELFLPRKSTPSRKVNKGSVAIGGEQTGVYPIESPGGWHIIGRTPLSFFDVMANPCCFITAGDQIRFKPISSKEFRDIELLVDERLYYPKKELLQW